MAAVPVADALLRRDSLLDRLDHHQRGLLAVVGGVVGDAQLDVGRGARGAGLHDVNLGGAEFPAPKAICHLRLLV
jgi:hypothetical protein